MPGLPEADRLRLEAFLEQARENTNTYLGYPAAKTLDYGLLKSCLDLPLNNVGDPFSSGTWKVDSHEFEREVLAFFADLLRAPSDDWWGYVTNGGTEGNLYGLYLARELYPKGMVYFSQDTHYSVSKNVHFLGMRHIMIRSQENGEIDYEDLEATLRIHRDVPPIIFANIGTTMTEARDDIRRIREMMDRMAIPNYYIHSDAAMTGVIAPFLESPPPYNFADGADSVSISGHKFLGSPIPCGIVMARKRHVDRIARSIAYIGNLDTTVTGSRNGLTPLILWQLIRSLGREGLQRRVEEALQLTAYAEQRLSAAGVAVWRNPEAITLVFPSPSQALIDKWQLASAQGISHLIMVPGVTRALLDRFIDELVSSQESAQHA
ncbi:histidine decarboxylase [Motiliproteus sp. SC1-56]|uniref:histidine decarboxylase n=1 Tax=Motiliproteus sp. SC1-56 TaxID=2799565 RepID=UPI001A8FB411|nr:histidine decarboxylase [Motiliproteus sp. SC1-56]